MSTEGLTAELEAALLRELQAHYDYENRVRFGNRLRPPVLVLADAQARLGAWVSAGRRIELARALVLDRPWLEITSVLEHEMAHQYVDEVLGVRDEGPHGDTFRRVCAERGIDARPAGAPVPSAAATPEALHALDRIRKLLALAGSPNQHEAELAMQKAHELMLRHNIEAARVHAERGFEIRHLGDPAKRLTRIDHDIAGLLADCFFVKAIRVPVYLPRLGKRGAVYEIIGTAANIEMAVHVDAFLRATAERLWEANRGDARVRSGRDRLSYQSGVIEGFRLKLVGERRQLARGHGLVWVGDAQLDGFYRGRYPRITHRRTTIALTGARQAGREAGQTIVLHRPMSSTGGGGRLLGSG